MKQNKTYGETEIMIILNQTEMVTRAIVMDEEDCDLLMGLKDL